MTFKGGPRAWYCPDCRHERRREATARYRKNGFTRHFGDTDTCIACGKSYIVNGGLQKYCPDCAPAEIKKIDANQGLDYYHDNKHVINPVRNINRRKPAEFRVCAACGKSFEAHGRNITCSDECRREHLRQYDRQYREKMVKKRNADK